MSSFAFSRTFSSIPAMTPFVGPETIERRRGKGFDIRIGANESAFGVSPKVQQAIVDQAGRVNHYCDPEHYDLRERLSQEFGVERTNIVIGEGIDGVLGVIVRAFTNPGDRIVTSAGAYPTFKYHVIGYGGELVFVPYRDDLHNDLQRLGEKAQEMQAKLVYLANPDNPTGTCHKADDIKALIADLPDNCFLVLDEAYAEFAPDEALPELDVADSRVIRLRTFSKSHGLAGLRVGYGIASAELIAAFDKIRLHFGVGKIAQVAALAALDDKAFAENVVRQVEEGRADYARLGRKLGVATVSTFTNFIPFDLLTAERSVATLSHLEERGVFVRRPGVAPLDRYVRVTVGTREERDAFATIFREVLQLL